MYISLPHPYIICFPFFPPQTVAANTKPVLYWMSLFAVVLQFLCTGTKTPEVEPVWQWHNKLSELHEYMVSHSWSRLIPTEHPWDRLANCSPVLLTQYYHFLWLNKHIPTATLQPCPQTYNVSFGLAIFTHLFSQPFNLFRGGLNRSLFQGLGLRQATTHKSAPVFICPWLM